MCYELLAVVKPKLVLVVSLVIGKQNVRQSIAIVTNFLLGQSFVLACVFSNWWMHREKNC